MTRTMYPVVPLPTSKRFNNLTGQRFNMLRVRRLVKITSAGAEWLCRCDCGRIKVYRSWQLTSGQVKSCGCYRSTPRTMLEGTRVGRLTIIRRLPNRRVQCRCDCGAIVRVLVTNLYGSTNSCGCLGDESRRVRMPEVGYGTAHQRVYTDRGPASAHQCVDCGGPAAHWAYDHADPHERYAWVGVKGRMYHLPYSLDVSHFQPMCVRCHKRFDLHGVDKGSRS